ncbi:DUF2637 domain-containing protein [Streptacidiphilus sp. PB12-B1b]|uniref:DUF2637 domain-containing protein n=1 Tax=Streptacidiphilus sp. PB12-B1b TaxID=2705012 RepID=UPI0015FE52B2|nr:DUF2637 domain-containing protein [Streptacidiphilus sp. PB12-B1b]QMU74603.1 DUF2637 domain-containing protein [Streptacidiphilus sp. PB12-B1b]
MPTTSPATRPTGSGAFARTTITTVMAVIAALAFTFSFGNVWALALRLGVSHPVAPLIAPMVDLSVVGLMVARHHLVTTGTDPLHLRSADHLMLLCGLLTLVLNCAEPLLAEHYGRAALDTVAPALLLGWGTVGPTLLRHLHHPTPAITDSADQSPSAQTPTTDLPPTELGTEPEAGPQQAQPPTSSEAPPPEHDTEPQPELVQASDDNLAEPSAAAADTPSADHEPATPRKRTGRPPSASMDELLAVARPAVAEDGVSVAVVKEALREAGLPISSERFTKLMKLLRAEQDGPQHERALAHPAVD